MLNRDSTFNRTVCLIESTEYVLLVELSLSACQPKLKSHFQGASSQPTIRAGLGCSRTALGRNGNSGDGAGGAAGRRWLSREA